MSAKAMSDQINFRVKCIVREGGSAMYKKTIRASSLAAAMSKVATTLGLNVAEAFPPSVTITLIPYRPAG